jgi:HAD superfamily hydrolase (TIGR01549 family)
MANKKYDAVFFDFDGTLCDSWQIVYKTYIETLLYFEPSASVEHVEAIRTCNDYMKSFQLLFKRQMVSSEILDYANITYYKNLDDVTPLFDGIPILINQLKNCKIPLGIVTTKKRIFVEKIISQYSVLQDFDTVICAEDVKNGKPNPEGLLKACANLCVDTGKSVYIGDLPADILAATNCGMDSILACYGYANDDDKKNTSSTVVAISPSDIEKILFF